MPKLSFKTTFYLPFLILAISLCCGKPCQNTLDKFQDFLQSRQQAGRFHPNAGMFLYRKIVFTKMECVDNCLRTAQCGSFEVRPVRNRNSTQMALLCAINKAVTSQNEMSLFMSQLRRSLTFNVSAQELEEVRVCFFRL